MAEHEALLALQNEVALPGPTREQQIARKMVLAGEFHVDGWTSSIGRQVAGKLEEVGIVRSHVSESEQYTAVNYSLTPLGKEYAAILRGQEEA